MSLFFFMTYITNPCLIRLSIIRSPLFPKKQAPEVTTFNSNYTVSVSLKEKS